MRPSTLDSGDRAHLFSAHENAALATNKKLPTFGPAGAHDATTENALALVNDAITTAAAAQVAKSWPKSLRNPPP